MILTKLFSLQKTDYQRVLSGVKDVKVSCAATGLQAFAPANLTERNASRLIVTTQAGKMNLLVVGLVSHLFLIFCQPVHISATNQPILGMCWILVVMGK